MKFPGRVSDGVVVLEGGQLLPEGAEVIVTLQNKKSAETLRAERVQFPLVRSKRPGAAKLTGEMLAEYLEDEDQILLCKHLD